MKKMKKMMLLMFMLISTAHASSVPCSSLWSLGFPQRGHERDAGTCHQFFPETVALPFSIEIYSQNAFTLNTETKQQLEWTADAAIYSSAKYEAFGSVPKLKIIYSELANPMNSEDFAKAYFQFFQLGTEYCPIIIYPRSKELSKDHFYQVIAHEIYHCVQKVNFPTQVGNAANSDENKFWLEGIAQFMSNEVYPVNDFEYHPMFGSFEHITPFFNQTTPYLSHSFFQSYFWFMGSNANQVHRLHQGFTGAQARENEVLSIPRISDAFLNYAKEISFRNYRDSSGREVNFNIPKQVVTVSEAAHSEYRVNFADFTVEPFELIFPKKGQYRVSLIKPDGTKLAIRKQDDTAWSDDIQNEFLTDCEVDRKLEGVFTRASSNMSMNSVRIVVDRRANSACPCDYISKPQDACMFGVWEIDRDHFATHFVQMTGGMIDLTDSSGTIKLSVTPENDFIWDFQNLSISGVTRSGRSPSQIKWNWNGVNNLRYSSQNRPSSGLMCGNVVSSTVVGTATMTVSGQTINIPAQSIPFVGSGESEYTCSEDLLHFTSPESRGIRNAWKFRRVSH